MVNPYALDVPGGVQLHVRDLAEHLIGHGHQVRVLAPADEDADLPDYVDPAGRAVPVPYNGSVARLLFGERAFAGPQARDRVGEQFGGLGVAGFPRLDHTGFELCDGVHGEAT